MVSPVLETAAIKSLTVALGARGKDGMLVPIGSIGTMTQAISSAGSDPIEIGVQGAHLFLRHKNLTTSIQLNDAAFPPYAQVMPKNLAMRVKIDRKELLRIVSLFMAARGEDKVKGCRIEVRPGDSLVVFSFDSPDSGSGTEQVSCDVLERDGDKKCVFGLDLNYVKAALNCVRTSAVILAGSGELDPVVVEEEYETKTKGAVPDYLCVIMPMRL
jgi:DNA polymerase III sliding clamp (beta) subunit (PCNA family)